MSHTNATLILTALAVLALGACSTPRKEVFREDAPTMATILGKTSGRSSPESFVGYSSGENADYTRDATTEIHQLFPTVANPTLVMYVFPHITAEGNPIPGYSTAMPMYENAVNFALPGERPAAGHRP